MVYDVLECMRDFIILKTYGRTRENKRKDDVCGRGNVNNFEVTKALAGSINE